LRHDTKPCALGKNARTLPECLSKNKPCKPKASTSWHELCSCCCAGPDYYPRRKTHCSGSVRVTFGLWGVKGRADTLYECFILERQTSCLEAATKKNSSVESPRAEKRRQRHSQGSCAAYTTAVHQQSESPNQTAAALLDYCCRHTVSLCTHTRTPGHATAAHARKQTTSCRHTPRPHCSLWTRP
jgi:hypothetical protein